MKRFTINMLAGSMAWALLLNSNAAAQSGGSFAPIETSSFPQGQIVTPVQNFGPTTQLGKQNSGFSGFKHGASSPAAKPSALIRKDGFNPTPFKVTGSQSATKPARGNQQTKPVSATSSTRVAQGRTSFGAPPIRPVQMTSSESSGSASPIPDSVDCPISSVHFMDDILLPAREPGEIKSLNFKEGDFVAAGQIIAQINDENYQLLLQQADMQYQIALDTAGDSTSTLAAKKKFQVASIEAKKTDRLAGTGSKSASDKMMATYSKEIAYLELQKANHDRKKARAEAELALNEKRQVQSKINRHTLRSDFDGYIIEIKKHKHEYVQLGEEILRLARMDRVWVQSVVDTKELNAHELMNKKVTVTIDLARGETAEFQGVVKFVGLERQGPELLMVKAEVSNRPINNHWILHPEAEVSMKIHLNDTSTSFGQN